MKGVASMPLFCCCYWKKVIPKLMIKWVWRGLNSMAHLLLNVTMCELMKHVNLNFYLWGVQLCHANYIWERDWIVVTRNLKWHWMMMKVGHTCYWIHVLNLTFMCGVCNCVRLFMQDIHTIVGAHNIVSNEAIDLDIDLLAWSQNHLIAWSFLC